MAMTFFEELQWRGLVQDISSPELIDKLNEGGLTFYIGTDPTADSMHIGHYSSFLISKRLAQHGHHPLLLVGGVPAVFVIADEESLRICRKCCLTCT